VISEKTEQEWTGGDSYTCTDRNPAYRDISELRCEAHGARNADGVLHRETEPNDSKPKVGEWGGVRTPENEIAHNRNS
jgi:hypothetical protein